MNDPYSVLGISASATDAEIKKAYREMVRKYHPDNYHNNPLSDLAQEKMKEINEAYSTLMKTRDGNGGYRPGAGTTETSGGSSEGSRVRAAINSGNIPLAEELLRAFPARNAEWNFLMGSVCYRKGWLDDAYNYFQAAVSMDPGNIEYRQAFAHVSQGGRAYNPFGQTSAQSQGCDACDCCAAMLCMNMCCRCG